MVNLLRRVDDALGRPGQLDLVDVGAGRAELLAGMLAAAPADLLARLRPVAVELAPRPPGLPATIRWVDQPPSTMTGLLLATEWLDNVPIDVATVEVSAEPADRADSPRYVLVDRDGNERPGPALDERDAAWLSRWWPLPACGIRAEIGRPRDEAWAAAVATVTAGLAVAVDYGHIRAERPPLGTLTGFRSGQMVPPVPDGSRDLTAHVALDAVAAAGERVAGEPATLIDQRTALRTLGVSGTRPPMTLASTDPAAYLRALVTASESSELTDESGLGSHRWLLQPVRIADPLA